MSRFPVPIDRKAHWTLIGDHRSRHPLHLSVMPQHVRCRSTERLKPYIVRQSSTSIVALLPPAIPLDDPPLPENPAVGPRPQS